MRPEVGVSSPDISTLPLLADLFGVSVDQLLGRETLSQSEERMTALIPTEDDANAMPEEVEEPEERLTEELLPVERLVVAEVEEPVERFVRVFWLTAPAERVLEEPEERLTEERLPEERLVWLCTEAERDGAAEADALP